MQIKYQYLFIIIVTCLIAKASLCQQSDTSNSIYQVSNKYYNNVDQKLSSIDKKLTRKSEKYLRLFQKQQLRIQKSIGKIDSNSNNYFAASRIKLTQLQNEIKSTLAKVGAPSEGSTYNAYLDTLGTTLKFLNKVSSQATNSLKELSTLQSKLLVSEHIQSYIAEQKNQIKQLLSQYTKLPSGLQKQYSSLNKTAYYYTAQVNEYKSMLHDEKKAEKEALVILNKLPAFQKFIKQNSQLASMFGLSDKNSSNPATALAGLQTRATSESLIQQKVSNGGTTAVSQIQQNIAQGLAEINKLKDKVNKMGGGASDIIIPDFKPNTQKTRNFLKRLEYGINLQFTKSTTLLPKTADVGLSIGYKINDKSLIGIGITGKTGIGTFQHFNISYQGIGLRTFLDYKIKKTYYISGGIEENYNSAFKNIEELKHVAWQKCALLGLSKKYQVSKKVKGELKVLYDLLAIKHVPANSPLVFRIGYIFK